MVVLSVMKVTRPFLEQDGATYSSQMEQISNSYFNRAGITLVEKTMDVILLNPI